MDMNEWLPGLVAGIRQTSVLEWITVIFGVTQVLLAKNNHILNYAAGIISTAISIYLFATVQLYAESLLNIYYLAMSIYGWIYWSGKNSTQATTPISKTTRREWLIVAAIVLIGWAILYTVLHTFTTSNVPGMDAWVAATAWAGMWLLARRKLENWILLNISNLFAIPLLAYKGLYLYATLTLILFIVAIFGYFKWRNIYRAQHAAA